ncbi:MFS general substrate transporter [Lophium mytilinum]|uniref:MFS general substrate transporter n=1 Tax=Lophium mytilinum TaxID=390894 RepID=A0A6A6QIX3_9PEZI|nr:MFS general substrate transporter [Lophium mytilinum]
MISTNSTDSGAFEKGGPAGSVRAHEVISHDVGVGSFEKDAALAIVGEHAQEIDEAVEKRVVRKIDMFPIPTMVLDTSRLSWATSLFYFGMLAGLYPMAFMLQRFNLGRILGGMVLIWALVCMLTATVTSWRGLYVQRFFLGVVESIIPTAFMCITSGYYTQSEQALRQAFWFSAAPLFIIIGGALNYGFVQIHGGMLKSWQYIYLLAGALTVVFGLMCFAIPNSPVSAWFLTPAERIVAVERLRRGQTGIREALLDLKIYLVMVMMASAYTINGAISGFGPLIVTTFGWSPLDAILLQFPSGGISFISFIAGGWLASRIPNVRLLILVFLCLPIIAGCAMICTKSVMAAAIFVALCVGNIVGPQLVRSQTKAQHYPELWEGLIISYCITITAAITLYYVLWRENKKREGYPIDEEERDRMAFMDLTDKENPYFRYVL